jgi:hypothetical protein
MSIQSLIKSPSCAAGSAGLALLLFWLAIEPSLAMKKSSMNIQKTVTLPTGKDIGINFIIEFHINIYNILLLLLLLLLYYYYYY